MARTILLWREFGSPVMLVGILVVSESLEAEDLEISEGRELMD